MQLHRRGHLLTNNHTTALKRSLFIRLDECRLLIPSTTTTRVSAFMIPFVNSTDSPPHRHDGIFHPTIPNFHFWTSSTVMVVEL
ncbi:MAG TPA: hypothetical protein PLS20_12330, partial [Ruminococcus flavefaciens]|nr:hypothetical protein [Ruminococcus flavefaciens]